MIDDELKTKIIKHVERLVKSGFIPDQNRVDKYLDDANDSSLAFDWAEFLIFRWARMLKDLGIVELMVNIGLNSPFNIKNSLLEVMKMNDATMEYFENYKIQHDVPFERFLMHRRRLFMSKEQRKLDFLKEIESLASVNKFCPHCGSHRVFSGYYEVNDEYNIGYCYLRCRKCGAMWANILDQNDDVCEKSLEEIFDMRPEPTKTPLELWEEAKVALGEVKEHE